MNGYLVGDAVTGACLLSVALQPAMGIRGFANKEGSDKVAAGATAAFAFAFLHRAAESSMAHPKAQQAAPSAVPNDDAPLASPSTMSLGGSSNRKWWMDVDAKHLLPDFFYTATSSREPSPAVSNRQTKKSSPTSEEDAATVMAKEEEMRALGVAAFPPNAAPIPSFTQTNDAGTQTTMSFYLHPAFPLFCVAVDSSPQTSYDSFEDDDDDNGEGVSSPSSSPSPSMGPFVAAAMTNLFLRHNGHAFLKSLQSRVSIKPADLKVMKKHILPHMKAVYKVGAGQLISNGLGEQIRRVVAEANDPFTTPSANHLRVIVEPDVASALRTPGSPPTHQRLTANLLGNNTGAGSSSSSLGQQQHTISILHSSLVLVGYEAPSRATAVFTVINAKGKKVTGGAVETSAAAKAKSSSSKKADAATNKNASGGKGSNTAGDDDASGPKSHNDVHGLFYLTGNGGRNYFSTSVPAQPNTIGFKLAAPMAARWAVAEARRMRQSGIIAARVAQKLGGGSNNSSAQALNGLIGASANTTASSYPTSFVTVQVDTVGPHSVGGGAWGTIGAPVTSILGPRAGAEEGGLPMSATSAKPTSHQLAAEQQNAEKLLARLSGGRGAPAVPGKKQPAAFSLEDDGGAAADGPTKGAPAVSSSEGGGGSRMVPADDLLQLATQVPPSVTTFRFLIAVHFSASCIVSLRLNLRALTGTAHVAPSLALLGGGVDGNGGEVSDRYAYTNMSALQPYLSLADATTYAHAIVENITQSILAMGPTWVPCLRTLYENDITLM